LNPQPKFSMSHLVPYKLNACTKSKNILNTKDTKVTKGKPFVFIRITSCTLCPSWLNLFRLVRVRVDVQRIEGIPHHFDRLSAPPALSGMGEGEVIPTKNRHNWGEGNSTLQQRAHFLRSAVTIISPFFAYKKYPFLICRRRVLRKYSFRLYLYLKQDLIRFQGWLSRK